MGALRAPDLGSRSVRSSCRSCTDAAVTATHNSALPFSLEDVDQALLVNVPVEMEYDAALEIERIAAACRPVDTAQAQLVAAVASARAAFGPNMDLWTLGCELRARHGYAVVLRRSLGPKQPKAYLRSLRHSFLVVHSCSSGGSSEQAFPDAGFIVDLNFKDAFTHAKTRSWYSNLLKALPQDYVGPVQSLTLVASIMAAATRLLFHQLSLSLPPWREAHSVLSRWVSQECDAFEDTIVPQLPNANLLAPYDASPFRRAAAATAAAAPAAGVPVSTASIRQEQVLATRQSVGFTDAADRLAPPPFVSRRWPRCWDSDAPHVVIFGFPEQDPHRLRRSSAPACVDTLSSSGSGGSSSCGGSPRRQYTYCGVSSGSRAPEDSTGDSESARSRSPELLLPMELEGAAGCGEATGGALVGSRGEHVVLLSGAGRALSQSLPSGVVWPGVGAERLREDVQLQPLLHQEGSAPVSDAQQQQQQQQHAEPPTAAGANHNRRRRSLLRHTVAGAPYAAVAAAAAAAEARDPSKPKCFKSLDQLLPKVCTVRLMG